MCLSDEFVVSSGARQLLDKFVHIMHIIVAYYPASAPSDSVFRALCTNSITYLLTLDLFAALRSSMLTPFFWGGGAALLGLLVILTLYRRKA